MLLAALRYKAWADGRTVAAVRQIAAQMNAAPFDFARQQLNHMVRVEELFRARLLAEAEPHDSTNTARLPTLGELTTRLDRSNAWLQAYAAGLSAEQWQEQLRFTFVDGQRGSLSRQEVVYHLVNHGTYHRGAIGHALDLAGGPRPADTFTVFIHAEEPGRRLWALDADA
ncbi:DinB family protein [Aquincola tertiaricarbonis]|uniref:DinB family protein n=1 Tax=Aquincola tertiaricarbonis TaxID=391953 RepID=A0ABY4S8H1_AQUTE|nr:DinB family protein [Aquincola tertiaricarbonis]URI07544.1 DinB family protein [Aquincola tertiaricarbonis]